MRAMHSTGATFRRQRRSAATCGIGGSRVCRSTGDGAEAARSMLKYYDSVVAFATGGYFGADMLTDFRQTRRKWLGGLFGGDSRDEESDTIDALKENTRALKSSTEQIKFGPRGAGAFPANWKTVMMEEALKQQAANLGTFQ